MIIHLILLLTGIVFLIKGSGLFVKSGALIAKKFHVSEFIIGLTLIALGTSLPELISSVIASSRKQSSLVLGTIIGANIANLTLIIGVASLINPIKVKKQVLRRDGYMIFFTGILLVLFSLDKNISRIEGAVFLLIFIAYNLFLSYSVKRIKGDYNFKEFIKYFFKFQYLSPIKHGIFLNLSKKYNHLHLHKKNILKSLIFLIVGGLLIYLGASIVVSKAIFFANYFQASVFLIGVLISIGTTLPELSVSISASRKKLGNIAIGNSLGSCITNILLILGISSIIFPITFVTSKIYFSLGFLIFFSAIVLMFIRTDYKIKRIEGIFLISSYLIFLTLLLLGIL